MPHAAESRRTPFAAVLRELRESAGLTQEDLAERAGISPEAVSALERGTRTRPYPHTVRSLADGLGATEAERAALAAAVPRRGSTSSVAATTDARARLPGHSSDHSLTVPATPLVGREADVRAINDLWCAGARLITLTGLGGVGKTRLAVAMADAHAPGHSDGTVMVALAALTDADEVVPTLARALGLTGGHSPDGPELVARHLEDLRLLLVLDNFEHLLSAATHVEELVDRCRSLRVLVTSRAPLGVRSEHEYAVPPLGLPSAAPQSLEELAGSAAGTLLISRARAVGSVPTHADAGPLGQLCHRLAGLPLALELASAHLRALSPETVLDRLETIMNANGARDLPERQRTMGAALDWSCELLSAQELTLFLLLGVFRGGATLETLEHVAAEGTDLDDHEVLGLLETLAAHSLIVITPSAAGGVRYSLLEPVAQFTRGRLVGPVADRAMAAHAAHYLAFAERAAVAYEREEQLTWLGLTEVEEANLLLAIDRSLDRGDLETACRITWSLWLYWWLRGQHTVGRRRADRCLAAGPPPRLLGRVHLAAATMSYAAGDAVAGGRHWTEAYRLGCEHGDAEIASKGAAGLGLAALAHGDLEEAGARFSEGVLLGEQAREAGVWLRALAHVWQGTVFLLRSDRLGATVEIGRGLELARERGDRLSTYVALYNLAQADIGAADYRQARAHLEEGVILSGQTQDRTNLVYFLEALAVVESFEGADERVATLLGAAAALSDEVGASVYMYYVPDEELRAAAERSARTSLGEERYRTIATEGRTLDLAGAVDFCLARRGGVR